MSGRDEDWPAWVFVGRSYVHLLDQAYRGMLEAAENAVSLNELALVDMSATLHRAVQPPDTEC